MLQFLLTQIGKIKAAVSSLNGKFTNIDKSFTFTPSAFNNWDLVDVEISGFNPNNVIRIFAVAENENFGAIVCRMEDNHVYVRVNQFAGTLNVQRTFHIYYQTRGNA